MTRRMRKALPAIVAALVMMVGCSGDISKSSSPVALNVTNTQTLTRIDISPGASGCNQTVATVNVAAILLSNPANANLPVDSRFNSVNLTGYTVSYQRRDGGTLVPAPFTRATSGTIAVGDTGTSLNNFLGIEPGALTLAPFAALTPSGGGKDPETGKTTVTMDLILTVFGETLAGERVSGTTRLTWDFCYSCSGCA